MHINHCVDYTVTTCKYQWLCFGSRLLKGGTTVCEISNLTKLPVDTTVTTCLYTVYSVWSTCTHACQH